MINFKALALTATLAAGTIFGAVAPAQAGTCWFERGETGRMAATYCQTNRRINYNGHIVWDIVDHQGTEFTLVFWADDTVEIIGIANNPIMGYTYTDSQGDMRIEVPSADFEMAIRA